jgi:hypothetical protein
LVDQELLNNTNASAMQQDQYTELINYLDLAMIPKEGKTAVVDFTVAILGLWIMFIEKDWHAGGWTSHSLFVVKIDMQRPVSVLLITLRTIFFSLSRWIRGWSTGSPLMHKLNL